MAEYLIKDTTLRDLADEIRRETGKTDPLLGTSMTNELRTFSDSLTEEIALQNTALDDLEAELNSLEEGIRPEGTLTITENGTYDVMNKANVDVNTPVPNGSLTVTENGTYNVSYKASVEVNTPVPEGTLVITENGTHDVSYKANVEVNVAGGGGSDSNKLALVAGTQSADNLYDITAADLDGVTEIGAYTFYGKDGLKSIELPPTCTSIGNNAFYFCNSLTSADMPNVTNIGGNTFYNCIALTSISMPNATSIGQSAFSNCSKLTSVDMPNVTSIGDQAFYNCIALTSISMPNATSIGQSAFSNCSKLTSVDMPNVTSLGVWAFDYCCALTSVSMPKVTSIAIGTFFYCSALTSVDMPKVTSIGYDAFRNCYKLTSLTIPSTCTSIESQALQCGGKCTFTFEGTTPPTIESDTFYASSINKIIVPKGYGETYKTATNWSSFADYIEEAAE